MSAFPTSVAHTVAKNLFELDDAAMGFARPRVGTPMTTIQAFMLFLMPSMAFLAVLLCKPAFRRRLALCPEDNRDLMARHIGPFAE